MCFGLVLTDHPCSNCFQDEPKNLPKVEEHLLASSTRVPRTRWHHFFPHSRWHGPILITFFCTNFLSKGDRRNEVSRWHGPSLIIFFCSNSLTQGDRCNFHWNFYEIWVSPSARDPGNSVGLKSVLYALVWHSVLSNSTFCSPFCCAAPTVNRSAPAQAEIIYFSQKFVIRHFQTVYYDARRTIFSRIRYSPDGASALNF